jgi:hypothetical protein
MDFHRAATQVAADLRDLVSWIGLRFLIRGSVLLWRRAILSRAQAAQDENHHQHNQGSLPMLHDFLLQLA